MLFSLVVQFCSVVGSGKGFFPCLKLQNIIEVKITHSVITVPMNLHVSHILLILILLLYWFIGVWSCMWW